MEATELPPGWVPTLADAEKSMTPDQRQRVGDFVRESKRLRLLRTPVGDLVEVDDAPKVWSRRVPCDEIEVL